MERDQQRRIVEALILASPEPISRGPHRRGAPALQSRAGARDRARAERRVRGAPRAFEIWEVAGGFQMRSLPEFAPYLRQIQKTRPLRLSQAALETLAIIAYRQPVTRAEIEHVRGVDVGARAAQPARARSDAHRGPSRGAGAADALRHHAPLPRGLRAGEARRSADAARGGGARRGRRGGGCRAGGRAGGAAGAGGRAPHRVRAGRRRSERAGLRAGRSPAPAHPRRRRDQRAPRRRGVDSRGARARQRSGREARRPRGPVDATR